MTNLSFSRLATAYAIAFALVLPMAAQTPGTGAIKGSVYDPAGLPMANVPVRVVNEATKAARIVDTASDGLFTATLLTPGSYSVTVVQPGLEQKGSHSVLVSVGETSALRVNLSLASTGLTVEVNGDTEVVQAQSATLGRTVNDRAIQSLPLANRNFTQILSLSPGVVVALPDATALGRGSQDVTTVGNKTTANNIQFNGIDANNLAQNSASNASQEVGIAVPAPDTIQEFKVQTANYDASYGRGTGANVDLISKAGSGQFHGSLWEFVRNDIFNANLFFLKADGNQPRPELKQNQFGGALGGPILRDKLFFFGAYQGLRSRNGVGGALTTFLPALGTDRSAATLGAEFCGSGPTFAGGTQLACDGSNINPVALNLLNLKLANGRFVVPVPQKLLPVVAGQTPVGQSTFAVPATYNEDQYTANLDEAITPKDQLVARFFYSRAPTIQAFAPNAANVPGWSNSELDQNAMLVLGYTHVFNANFVNLARFGYTNFSGNSTVVEPISANDIGTESPQGTSAPTDPVPSFIVSGLFAVGDGGTPFLEGLTNSFIWQDTASMTHGRHSLSAGVEVKRYQVMVNSPFVSSGVAETLTLNDFLIGQNAAQNGSPDGMSNIFLTAASSGIFRKDQRYNDFAGFAKDDFRLNSRAALFVGLRYEIFGSPTEAHQRFASFDPSIASSSVPAGGSLSGFLVPHNFPGSLPDGVTRTNRDGFWPNNYADVSPRVGFAIRLSDTPTVLLRGGYGIYFDRLSAGLIENLVGQSPFALDQTLFFAQTAGSSEQQPFSPTLPATSSYPSFIPRFPGGAQTISSVDPNITDPYTHEFNLNIQTALGRDYLLEIGYVGTRSLHIPGGVEFNQALLASPQNPINGETTNTAANITNRLPFAGVATGSLIYQTRFLSNYNSLQASLTKRLRHDLQFLASYTWSKNLDQTSGTNGSPVYEEWLLSNNQNNPRQAYGPTDFDRKHRAVLSLVYQVPFYAGYTHATAHVFNGWEISTIAVAQSGSPLTITDSSAGGVYGNFENRAEAPASNPLKSGSIYSRVQSGYLNGAAFPSAPIAPFGLSSADTDFGDSRTGFLRGPGQRNIDLAVERSFRITEAIKLHFRTELFNLTNSPNFGNPNTNLSSGQAFGTISGTANNPRIIQFAAKILF